MKTAYVILLICISSLSSCEPWADTSEPPPDREITQIKEIIVTPDTANVGALIKLNFVLDDTTSPERWVFDWVPWNIESEYVHPIRLGGRVDTAIVYWDSSEIEDRMPQLNREVSTITRVIFVDEPDGSLVRASARFEITLLLNQ